MILSSLSWLLLLFYHYKIITTISIVTIMSTVIVITIIFQTAPFVGQRNGSLSSLC